MSDFAEALALVLQMEGGRVDDPRDPGGRTNCGVTQRTYDAWRQRHAEAKRSVFAITPTEIEALYREDFAKPLRFDELPAGLAYALLDAGVNSGPVRAIRWLQGVAACRATGHLESTTLHAVHRANSVSTIERLCEARLGMLRHLPTWTRFGRGWSRRVAFVRSHALAMARRRAATD